MDSWYDRADLVVLTSRSEGIPLVLMEAMARGRIVLAPAITGIPELVIAGKTGFLYEPGSLQDFVARLLFIRSLMHAPEAAQLSPYTRSAATQLERMRPGGRSAGSPEFQPQQESGVVRRLAAAADRPADRESTR